VNISSTPGHPYPLYFSIHVFIYVFSLAKGLAQNVAKLILCRNYEAMEKDRHFEATVVVKTPEVETISFIFFTHLITKQRNVFSLF
jgi:hypothetical protein